VLNFGQMGRVSFLGTSNALTIDNNPYTLVSNIKTLASDIATNPSGFYALANNYDASADGTYFSSPIPTTFTGTLEGLGNAISKFSLSNPAEGDAALFVRIDTAGTVAHFHLLNIELVTRFVGAGLAVISNGTLTDDSASGEFSGLSGVSRGVSVAGLVNVNGGNITGCHANVQIIAGTVGALAGGLVAQNEALIEDSWATGSVEVQKGTLRNASRAGGLVGINDWSISNSYSSAKVRAKATAWLGGLVGLNDGFPNTATISDSYASGIVTGSLPDHIGGLIGWDSSASGNVTDTYWDTTTSGITNLSQGAGSPSNDPGITGLTGTQLQSGLPAGLDSSIWSEKSTINGGLPYLLAAPPPH